MASLTIEISVVVNGQPVPSKIDVDDPFLKLVNDVLESTGNTGQPFENWELRDASGNIIDLDKTAKALGLKDGAKLFLNLKAGIGGS